MLKSKAELIEWATDTLVPLSKEELAALNVQEIQEKIIRESVLRCIWRRDSRLSLALRSTLLMRDEELGDEADEEIYHNIYNSIRMLSCGCIPKRDKFKVKKHSGNKVLEAVLKKFGGK